MCFRVYIRCPSCNSFGLDELSEVYECDCKSSEDGCPGMKSGRRSPYGEELADFRCCDDSCPLSARGHATEQLVIREQVRDMRREYDGPYNVRTDDLTPVTTSKRDAVAFLEQMDQNLAREEGHKQQARDKAARYERLLAEEKERYSRPPPEKVRRRKRAHSPDEDDFQPVRPTRVYRVTKKKNVRRAPPAPMARIPEEEDVQPAQSIGVAHMPDKEGIQPVRSIGMAQVIVEEDIRLFQSIDALLNSDMEDVQPAQPADALRIPDEDDSQPAQLAGVLHMAMEKEEEDVQPGQLHGVLRTADEIGGSNCEKWSKEEVQLLLGEALEEKKKRGLSWKEVQPIYFPRRHKTAIEAKFSKESRKAKKGDQGGPA